MSEPSSEACFREAQSLFGLKVKDLQRQTGQNSLADLSARQLAYVVSGALPLVPAADVYDCGGEMVPWMLCFKSCSQHAYQASLEVVAVGVCLDEQEDGCTQICSSLVSLISSCQLNKCELRKLCQQTGPAARRGHDCDKKNVMQTCRHLLQATLPEDWLPAATVSSTHVLNARPTHPVFSLPAAFCRRVRLARSGGSVYRPWS